VYRTGLVLLCIDDSSLSRSVYEFLGRVLALLLQGAADTPNVAPGPQHWLQQPSLTGMYVDVVMFVPVVVITKTEVQRTANTREKEWAKLSQCCTGLPPTGLPPPSVHASYVDGAQ
jgi:hypothetical protein